MHRADGSSLAKAIEHYWIAPWRDPVGWWSNEIRHAAYIIMDPIGHAVGHHQAAMNALREGRPIDSLVARLNDMWEPQESLSPVARALFPEAEVRSRPGDAHASVGRRRRPRG
jgi:hypothetical protein